MILKNRDSKIFEEDKFIDVDVDLQLYNWHKIY